VLAPLGAPLTSLPRLGLGASDEHARVVRAWLSLVLAHVGLKSTRAVSSTLCGDIGSYFDFGYQGRAWRAARQFGSLWRGMGYDSARSSRGGSPEARFPRSSARTR